MNETLPAVHNCYCC